MITAAQLRSLLQDQTTAAALRESLAVGLQQETVQERRDVIQALIDFLGRARKSPMIEDMDVFQVLLDAVCKEVIVTPEPKPWYYPLLYYALMERRTEAAVAVMAVVERMRKDGLRARCAGPLRVLFYRVSVSRDVEEAVISVVDPSVFGMMTEDDDPLRSALRCREEKIARAVRAVLKHGPSMEQRLEAGMERFRYVNYAAQFSELEALQQVHDLLPLLSDGSGRRGELVDYAQAIDVAAGRPFFGKARMVEYLAEQAGGEEVFNLCCPSALLNTDTSHRIVDLMSRAPQLVEGACKHPRCLPILASPRSKRAILAVRMAELVDPKVLCSMMRQEVDRWRPGPFGREKRPCWMSTLSPIHEAVPECMDGRRWKWLVLAIVDKGYKDVEYMLGMCTREHLIMRDEEGDTAYDMAARDASFPKELLERLKVATKGAHT